LKSYEKFFSLIYEGLSSCKIYPTPFACIQCAAEQYFVIFSPIAENFEAKFYMFIAYLFLRKNA